ncbi:MAG: biliverdin-producing heme oxygenase [Fimbriiglobus sp.]
MELTDELRAATRAAHTGLEELPVARAMAGGTVDRTTYAALLARLYWVHAGFEAAVAGTPDLAAVWPPEAVRAAAVARDLAALGADPVPEPADVAAWAARVGGLGRPAAAWAGVGYVLEGSRLGGRVLVGSVARGLNLPAGPGVGLDYHREGLDDAGGRWGRVRAALAAADRTPEDRAALVAAAVATFDVMARVHI